MFVIYNHLQILYLICDMLYIYIEVDEYTIPITLSKTSIHKYVYNYMYSLNINYTLSNYIYTI